MVRRLEDARILMYSHDTFGLGHLRRCRTIAHSLVEDFRGLQVLIISGATIAGAFDYRARVDFVKIPSVIKLRNGEYTSMERHIDLNETLKMRAVDHPLDGRDVPARHLHRRQGADGPARRGRGDAFLSQDARHDAGPRPARGHGCAGTARRRMEAQRRHAQDRHALRHDLGLWAAGLLRSADRPRRAGQCARQDEVRRLPAAQPAAGARSPATGRKATICWSPPAAAATAPS